MQRTHHTKIKVTLFDAQFTDRLATLKNQQIFLMDQNTQRTHHPKIKVTFFGASSTSG